jgi:hypothetical protein
MLDNSCESFNGGQGGLSTSSIGSNTTCVFRPTAVPVEAQGPSGQRDRRSIASVRQMQIGLGLVFLTRIDPVE